MMKKIFAWVLSVTMIFSVCTVVLATEKPADSTTYTVDTPYEYPVVLRTDEWGELQSLAEKIEVCAVDEELMKSMTTEALLETVLNYPLLGNIYAFNTLEQGFASVSSYFPGIELLLAREDAESCIQSILDVEVFSDSSSTEELVRQGFLYALTRYMADDPIF